MQRFALLAIAVAASGCGDDICGAGDAPDVGIVASTANGAMTYGNFTAGPHHDCTETPTVVESLTFGGVQQGSGNLVTFCVPRPDRLRDGVPIGTGLQIVDFSGEANGCSYCFSAGATDGTARASGLCDDGTNSAGFALTLDGNIGVKEFCPAILTCPTGGTEVTVQLSGTVAIRAVE
jgi:hypothetical protein